MLLYIHVPFCRSKCEYCAFHSMPLPQAREQKIVAAYTESLGREMRLQAGRMPRRTLSGVFFGGGTPSLLPVASVAAILEEAARNFHLLPDAEITMEANPDSALAPGWMQGVRDLGVTRLSLGVQSFNPAQLRLLGRIHTADQAKKAAFSALSAGFQSVSLDLMWGLPGQTLEDWLEQLDTVRSLGPGHVSAYGLTLEPGLPLTEKILDGRLNVPPEDVQAEMFLRTAPALAACGLKQYEISNYARPGLECRHNLGYWSGRDYLGLGPSATSTVGDSRWTNPEDMRTWELVTEEKIFVETEELTPHIRARELLMLRLRTNQGLLFEHWRELTGEALPPAALAQAKAMKAARLLEMDEDGIRLTPNGMLLSNLVIERLFTALSE